jgi:TolB-like protein
MGEQQVKNIARPIRVYARRPEPTPALTVSTAMSKAATAPRLSIVVLPFANLSDHREQQYFVDGITDDLTTDLSRIVGMVVISRSTAFTYRDKLVGAKQVGRELGVSYVLEGSVRRSGSRVRLNAHLVDVHTDAHLWAERFECNTAELFALQNEITSQIALVLSRELIRAEAIRPTEHPGALDYILRGRAVMLKPSSRDSYADGINLFERALALDPSSVEAQSRGSTYENRANLAPRFFDQVIRKYEGTRLGRQELNTELLDDTPGALWSHAIIDAARISAAPSLHRIVVAINPALTSGEDADETGIVEGFG